MTQKEDDQEADVSCCIYSRDTKVFYVYFDLLFFYSRCAPLEVEETTKSRADVDAGWWVVGVSIRKLLHQQDDTIKDKRSFNNGHSTNQCISMHKYNERVIIAIIYSKQWMQRENA